MKTHDASEPEPSLRASEAARADEVWAALTALVTNNFGEWRRAVTDELGLPSSRVRVLRRLAAGPMTMKSLADAASIDAPAATVAVNDLEKHGLVERTGDPQSRRVKIVALTTDGREALDRVDRVHPTAPPEFSALDSTDVEALAGILSRLQSSTPTPTPTPTPAPARARETTRE